jgi:hypothetical protein
VQSAGDVSSVQLGEKTAVEEPGRKVERRRQIRIDLRRTRRADEPGGELVVAKGRLSELAAVSDSPDLKAVAARIGG